MVAQNPDFGVGSGLKGKDISSAHLLHHLNVVFGAPLDFSEYYAQEGRAVPREESEVRRRRTKGGPRDVGEGHTVL